MDKRVVERFFRRWMLIALGALSLALLSGCTYFWSPQKTVMAYIDASKRDDPEETWKYVTDEDRKLLRSSEQPAYDSRERAINKFMTDNTSYKIKSIERKGKDCFITAGYTAPNYISVCEAAIAKEVMYKSEFEILQFMNRNKALISTSSSDCCFQLKREHDGWKVFLDCKGQLERSRKEAERKQALLKEYSEKVEFRNLTVSYNGSFWLIEAEVKNAGPRTITWLDVNVIGLDAEGKAVFKEDKLAVYKPLAPNFSTELLVLLDNPPSDWSEEVIFEIASIDLE